MSKIKGNLEIAWTVVRRWDNSRRKVISAYAIFSEYCAYLGLPGVFPRSKEEKWRMERHSGAERGVSITGPMPTPMLPLYGLNQIDEAILATGLGYGGQTSAMDGLERTRQ